MQVIGGEVGPEVGAVTEDRAVLHEAVVQKDLLARADVVPGKEHPAAGIHHAVRDRRIRLVGQIGQQAEDEETDNDDQARDLQPGA